MHLFSPRTNVDNKIVAEHLFSPRANVDNKIVAGENDWSMIGDW